MTRKIYSIYGLVQGVGFRPHIYRVATRLKLKGFVKNTQDGVKIDIQGDIEDIKRFENELDAQNLPELASIQKITTKELEPLYREQFEIIQSTMINASKQAMVLPDVAVCEKCIEDTSFPSSRYYNYFATTCTNCGPRYSIIQTVPYDRVNTSMQKFKMCSSCEDEYSNPLSRRYHAQPISCYDCGPKLNITIENIAKKIQDAKIVAIKGIGGFHIVCDATNLEVIKKLRVYKNRPTKPFAIMCKDMKEIKRFAKVSKKEQEILTSKETPIVVLKKLKTLLLDGVAPNIDKIGCFLPYTPLQHLLFMYLKNPIIATSANLGDEPIIIDAQTLKEKLPFIDAVLDFDRDIINAIDDSLVQVVDNKIQTLRLARGYAPKSIKLPYKLDKKVLAIGANQKNNIVLGYEDNLIISPYIGDLNSIANIEFFKRTIQTFKKFYDFEPDIIIHDKHPNYETTKWAKEQNKELFEVQHHLAHIYATKAEFGLVGDFLGFSFDGTGYGDDGVLWGGEVFVADERKYHFKPIKLLGGEKAIKEPRRVALSMLFDKYDLDAVLEFELPFTKQEIKLLHQSYIKNLNTPLSTSVGRLFDGVASLANLCHTQSYEGESGLLCENFYNIASKESFDFSIENGVIDIEFNFFDEDIVSKFINTLVKIILYIAQKESLDVILSGGVFQNKTLLTLVITKLKKHNITYYHQQQTPINDGGISLGQLYYFLQKGF
ncbi:MAG: carbamoyltransferase HypF [Epsilonproteobacteria bacterium]|nr:carbamoyltransferase HypF [Campylobacterota bacterium]